MNNHPHEVRVRGNLMSGTPALRLLADLEPKVGELLDRHLMMAETWMPHDYVPWSRGRDFDAEPWTPAQPTLPLEVQASLEVNTLTEDNLPTYHAELVRWFSSEGAWGSWTRLWTAEEARHGAALRDYLLVTREADPAQLELDRMANVRTAWEIGDKDPLRFLVYVAFQELATRLSHRNTGRRSGDPTCDRLLSRIAADENLHMIFYRDLVTEALGAAPSETVTAVCAEVIGFQMPGVGIRDFWARARLIARAGIYDLRIHHDHVLQPLLRHWRIADLSGLDARASRARDGMYAFLAVLDAKAGEIEEKRATRAAASRSSGTRATAG